MRKIVVKLLLLSIALAIGAIPLSARDCVASSCPKQTCDSCCRTKTCCAEHGKKDDSATQPLATGDPGYELSFNVLVSWSEIAPAFCRAQRSLNHLPFRSGKSPPNQVFLCTFLI